MMRFKDTALPLAVTISTNSSLMDCSTVCTKSEEQLQTSAMAWKLMETSFSSRTYNDLCIRYTKEDFLTD